MRITWVLVGVLLTAGLAPAEWSAGVASVTITPDQPIWMSGYASRDRPAEGKLHALHAKALALDDGRGHRTVLVTMDLCGIDRELSRRVCRRIAEKNGLERAAIALNVSHTHTGPVVGNNLRSMYFLDERQQRLVDEYTRSLEDRLVAVGGEALGAMKPARLQWGVSHADFAVNRRNNKEEEVPRLRAEGNLKGPVDHDVPVLVVRPLAGDGPRAVVFGYACHATTLSFYQWSGDWPGFAQVELEKQFPGSTALFVAGCGADQNPLPRRTVQLAREYGHQAATGEQAALNAGLKPIEPALDVRYDEIDLPFGTIPTRQQLETDSKSSDRYVAQRAKLLLAQWDRDGGIKSTYPYPVQIWQLGRNLQWVLLGGEVVVDYSLRLKKELGADATWISAYCNDVMAYVPSRRVLDEGGYEGGGAMLYYGLPSPWGQEVEERIVREVHRLSDEGKAAVP
jgi:neutral ceramidase